MEQAKKPRLFYLDFTRSIALISILVIHFNAAVTGYFTYPSKLFGSILPFGIYLGDFGSSLFFIVSGAALAYTTRENLSPIAFYKKRAAAVYPMFWLAWLLAFSFRFVLYPGYFSGARTPTLALTALGLDNFAVAAGWVSQDFACVGEWFLGSILFLYLLFPLLKKCLRKHPVWTFAGCLCVCLPVHLAGWDAHLVAIHIPEFLFGMLFVALSKMHKGIAFAASAVLLLVLQRVADTKILCALMSGACFVALYALAQLVDCKPLNKLCILLGKYSYAIFLVHHIIIWRLVEGFDLALISRRDTVLLFCVYLTFTGFISYGLYHLCAWLQNKLRSAFFP